MTIEEVKKRLEAVFRALDSVEIAGYGNVRNMSASMTILDEILRADIQAADQNEPNA